MEAVAGGRETLRVEFRIALGAGAEAMAGERGLVAVDEGHAIGARIAAQDAGLAQRQRLQLRQEFAIDEVRHGGEPLRLGGEGGVNIEARPAPRAPPPALPPSPVSL